MIHKNRSMRMPGYDYTQPGAYFITICVRDRACLFGEIKKGIMQLNEFGIILNEKWRWLGVQYPYIRLDEYVIMPNHFHGIFWIRDVFIGRCGSRPVPTENIKIKPVGQIIGAFKTVTAKQINTLRGTQGSSLWQRDFYDHIGRNEIDVNRIRHYIRDNPANWEIDEENALSGSPNYISLPNSQWQ
jgi:putative transposase